MSLVDSKFDPFVPPVEVLNVKVTCTNRDLPGKLPFGGKEGDFEAEGGVLVSKGRCLTKPTETIRPPQRKSAQWRLISHLNLNYLSIVNSEDGKPEALQEILSLYNFTDSSAIRNQILGITGIEAQKAVRQIGGQSGPALCEVSKRPSRLTKTSMWEADCSFSLVYSRDFSACIHLLIRLIRSL